MKFTPYFSVLLCLGALLNSCKEKKAIPVEQQPVELSAPSKEDAKIEKTIPKEMESKSKTSPPSHQQKTKKKTTSRDTLRPLSAR